MSTSQSLFLALSPLIALSAMLPANAQGVGTNLGTTDGGTVSSNFSSRQLISQNQPASSSIIPTDVLPLPAAQERMSYGENIQLRILQRLPSRFYFNSSVENSFRYETNPYQFPTKRSFLKQLPAPSTIRQLNAFQQAQIFELLGFVNNDDVIFRCLPNVTGGWTLTPKTRLFANYFMIRDQLAHNIRLNTVIHSISGGIQQDIPVTRKGNLQAEVQFRELYQLHQQPVFDYLPALTFSYALTPRTIGFVNALLQLRGKRPFQAPTREIDPFYTFGMLHQRGKWSGTCTATFVQNFREPFRKNASIPVNNYSWIMDIELARRIVKQVPGLQAFIRAEPIWNYHSHNRPGLTGMDFRIFFGLRAAVSKAPLTAALQQIEEQLKEQEGTPPTPVEPGGSGKPSAYLQPYQVIADNPQPIHGFRSADGTEEIASLPAGMTSTSNSSDNATNLAPIQLASYQGTVSDTVKQEKESAPQNIALSQPKVDVPVLSIKPERAKTIAETPMVVYAPTKDEMRAGLREAKNEFHRSKEEMASPRIPDIANEPELNLVVPEQKKKLHKGNKNFARRSENQALIASQDNKLPKAKTEIAKSDEVPMMLVPPMPQIKATGDTASPIQDSGLELTPPPILMR